MEDLMGSDEAQMLSDVRELSAQVAKLIPPRGTPTYTPCFSDGQLADFAAAIYGARMERSRCLPMSLFGEPAWDMLLDLFINTVRGLRLGTTSLCLGSNAPQSTALRYIERLEEEGLVRRYQPVDDRRLHCVELTPRGKKQMRECLSLMLTRSEPDLR
jgi:predicted transcriptional regulator